MTKTLYNGMIFFIIIIMVIIYDATVSFSDGVRQQDKNKTNKKTMQNANGKMLLTI